MVTEKIRAIWRVITCKHLLLFTKHKEIRPKVVGFGKGDLHDIFSMAVEIKASYDYMIKLCEEVAAEEGELHILNELKKTVEEYTSGGE